MDLNSLNENAPISALTVVFFAIAAVALFVMLFGRTIALKKFKKQTAPGSIFITSFAILTLAFVGAFVSVLNSRYEVLNNSFHEKLSVGYGLHTDSTEFAVERAAADERFVTMTDESGATVLVQPYRDGDTLTFYKVDRGELIKPRM